MKAAIMIYGHSAGRTCGNAEAQIQTRQPEPLRNRDAQCTSSRCTRVDRDPALRNRGTASSFARGLGLLMMLFRAALVLPADASDAF